MSISTIVLNPFLELHVDLGKITSNYQKLCALTNTEVASVVKANGYGVGAVPVSLALFDRGCRKFFVATLDEALELRAFLPTEALIYIFNGFVEEHILLLFEKNIIPVLTTLDHIKLYKKHGGRDYFLHFDTGMNRLSLSAEILEHVCALIDPAHVSWVMSHLACADELESPKNREQLENFLAIADAFPAAKKSLVASKGVNLGPDYYFHQVRVGIYLYGLSPSQETTISKDLSFALKMRAQVLETKTLRKGESVGYNATYVAPSSRRIATLGVGYADGIPLSFSNKNHFWVGDQKVPLLGRVSMDLCAIDVTDVPEQKAHVGSWVDLVRDPVSFYHMAKAAGSSPHEMLTRIGKRYKRIYTK